MIIGFYDEVTKNGEKSPEYYKTELMIMIAALQSMGKQATNKWLTSHECIGVLIGDSLAWQPELTSGFIPLFTQNIPTQNDKMAHFFGIALPLMNKGFRVEVLPEEGLLIEGSPIFLDRLKYIIVSYEGWILENKQVHRLLKEWVHKGGNLIVVGKDDLDCTICGWWQEEGFDTLLKHLAASLGLDQDKFKGKESFIEIIGMGKVVYIPEKASSLAYKAINENELIEMLTTRMGNDIKFGNGTFVLKRGDFIIGYTIKPPYTIMGDFINLFSSKLEQLNQITLNEGEGIVLLDLEGRRFLEPELIFSSGRLKSLDQGEQEITFIVSGPDNTIGSARVYVGKNRQGCRVFINDQMEEKNYTFDEKHNTLLIQWSNMPEGVSIRVYTPKDEQTIRSL